MRTRQFETARAHLSYLKHMEEPNTPEDPATQRRGISKGVPRGRGMNDILKGAGNLAAELSAIGQTAKAAQEMQALTASTIRVKPDTSPRRTADNTETMANTMTDMLAVTTKLAELTKANIEQSEKAERRTLFLTIASIAVAVASLGTAITSLVLTITNAN